MIDAPTGRGGQPSKRGCWELSTLEVLEPLRLSAREFVVHSYLAAVWEADCKAVFPAFGNQWGPSVAPMRWIRPSPNFPAPLPRRVVKALNAWTLAREPCWTGKIGAALNRRSCRKACSSRRRKERCLLCKILMIGTRKGCTHTHRHGHGHGHRHRHRHTHDRSDEYLSNELFEHGLCSSKTAHEALESAAIGVNQLRSVRTP